MGMNHKPRHLSKNDVLKKTIRLFLASKNITIKFTNHNKLHDTRAFMSFIYSIYKSFNHIIGPAYYKALKHEIISYIKENDFCAEII